MKLGLKQIYLISLFIPFVMMEKLIQKELKYSLRMARLAALSILNLNLAITIPNSQMLHSLLVKLLAAAALYIRQNLGQKNNIWRQKCRLFFI